jgi:hypothetical protein
MIKLASVVVASSLALAGAALANSDKTSSPSVSPNTDNPQGTSYNDKSNTAKGTNAIMDDTAKAKAEVRHDSQKATKKKLKTDTSMKSDTTIKSDTSLPADTTANPTTTMGGGAAPNAPVAGSKDATVGSTEGKSGQ